jgi:hypothetical protein
MITPITIVPVLILVAFKTLRRTVSSLLPVLQQDTRISIVLVLEEWNASNFKDCEDDNISICSVPTNYTARKAKNKARALEYYRQTANFGRHDWVLHLDEETVIELHALQACIDFIQRRPNEAFLFAQVHNACSLYGAPV